MCVLARRDGYQIESLNFFFRLEYLRWNLIPLKTWTRYSSNTSNSPWLQTSIYRKKNKEARAPDSSHLVSWARTVKRRTWLTHNRLFSWDVFQLFSRPIRFWRIIDMALTCKRKTNRKWDWNNSKWKYSTMLSIDLSFSFFNKDLLHCRAQLNKAIMTFLQAIRLLSLMVFAQCNLEHSKIQAESQSNSFHWFGSLFGWVKMADWNYCSYNNTEGVILPYYASLWVLKPPQEIFVTVISCYSIGPLSKSAATVKSAS